MVQGRYCSNAGAVLELNKYFLTQVTCRVPGTLIPWDGWMDSRQGVIVSFKLLEMHFFPSESCLFLVGVVIHAKGCDITVLFHSSAQLCLEKGRKFCPACRSYFCRDEDDWRQRRLVKLGRFNVSSP